MPIWFLMLLVFLIWVSVYIFGSIQTYSELIQNDEKIAPIEDHLLPRLIRNRRILALAILLTLILLAYWFY